MKPKNSDNLLEAEVDKVFSKLKTELERRISNWEKSRFPKSQIVKSLETEKEKYRKRQTNPDGNYNYEDLPPVISINTTKVLDSPLWQAMQKGELNPETIPHNDPDNPIVAYRVQNELIRYLEKRITSFKKRKEISMRIIALVYHFRGELINRTNQDTIAQEYNYTSENSGKKLGDQYRSLLNQENRQKATNQNLKDLKCALRLLEEDSQNTERLKDEIRIVKGKISEK